MTRIKHKKALVAFAAAAVLALGVAGLAGCSSSGSASSASGSGSAAASDDNVIVVAATPVPHGDILTKAVAPELEKAGYTLEVKEFTDYVLPNTVTEEGEVDANYFQHVPYLDNFNAEHGTHLVSVAGVHIEPMRIYAGTSASLEDLPDGARVAVPNDVTNEARALLLLQAAGLIELNDPTNLEATKADISSNPHNLDIVEVEAATVTTLIPEVDIAVVNINYALDANLPDDTILFTENADSPYVNVLVVKDGNQDSEKVKALAAAINSDAVRDYIDTTYSGEIVATF